ncbi:MAG: hypothetical protein ACI4ST_02025, partial [Candidatus Gallimonas sp.]
MHKFFSKYGKLVLIALIAVTSVVLLIAAVLMLMNYSDDISVRATSEAQKRTLKVKSEVYEKLTENTSGAVSLALLLSDCDNELDVYGIISGALQKSEFREVRFVRYYSGEKLYSENGEEYTGKDSSREHRKETPAVPGYTGIFNDESYNMSVAGFYAPVTGSSVLDAVVIYYPRNKLISLYSDDTVTADAEFSVLALDNEKAEILVGGDDLPASSLKESLRTMTGETDRVNAVLNMIHGGLDGTVKVRINTADYVVSVCADKEKLKDLSVVELYRVNVLCATDFDIVDTIIMIMVLFAVVTILIIVYLIVRRVRREKEFFNMQTSDVKLQCLNRRGFEELAADILARNNTEVSPFYVVVMHL